MNVKLPTPGRNKKYQIVIDNLIGIDVGIIQKIHNNASLGKYYDFSKRCCDFMIAWSIKNMDSPVLCSGKLRTFICSIMRRQKMEELRQLSKDQILMGFVASCVEDVANRLGADYSEIYRRMDAVGMIDGYIIPFYNTLHTESRENLTDSLIESLKRWEEEKK